jgi:hypothetical protein
MRVCLRLCSSLFVGDPTVFTHLEGSVLVATGLCVCTSRAAFPGWVQPTIERRISFMSVLLAWFLRFKFDTCVILCFGICLRTHIGRTR